MQALAHHPVPCRALARTGKASSLHTPALLACPRLAAAASATTAAAAAAASPASPPAQATSRPIQRAHAAAAPAAPPQPRRRVAAAADDSTAPSTSSSAPNAAKALAAAHERYAARDYMPALRLYEAVAQQKPPAEDAGQPERRAALYGCTAVHTAFGDVELAQITLREGVTTAGLDFEAAMADPTLPDLVGATQILIQLRRFNGQLLQKQAQGGDGAGAGAGAQRPGAKPSAPRPAPPPPSASSKPAGGGGSLMDRDDLASILGSSKGDRAEVDTTVRAVLKRVALLVLAGVGLGAALFYLGLEYMFPKEIY